MQVDIWYTMNQISTSTLTSIVLPPSSPHLLNYSPTSPPLFNFSPTSPARKNKPIFPFRLRWRTMTVNWSSVCHKLSWAWTDQTRNWAKTGLEPWGPRFKAGSIGLRNRPALSKREVQGRFHSPRFLKRQFWIETGGFLKYGQH